MAKTQWHPLFASLLEALLCDYYDLETEVPVSELPRRGDILIVRKHDGPPSPFTGLWGWLRDWNVIEFKGVTDHADAADLELLIHVGTGLTYKINEDRRERREGRLANRNVAFWYVAPRIGPTFLRLAQEVSPLTGEGGGVFRGAVGGHPLFIVSAELVPMDEMDSLPLALLREEVPRPAVEMLASNRAYVERIKRWLGSFHPGVWQEVRDVDAGPKIKWDEVAKITDLREVLPAISVPLIIEGLMQRADPAEVSAAWPAIMELLVQRVPPEQAQELVRQLTQRVQQQPQESAEAGDAP